MTPRRFWLSWSLILMVIFSMALSNCKKTDKPGESQEISKGTPQVHSKAANLPRDLKNTNDASSLSPEDAANRHAEAVRNYSQSLITEDYDPGHGTSATDGTRTFGRPYLLKEPYPKAGDFEEKIGKPDFMTGDSYVWWAPKPGAEDDLDQKLDGATDDQDNNSSDFVRARFSSKDGRLESLSISEGANGVETMGRKWSDYNVRVMPGAAATQ